MGVCGEQARVAAEMAVKFAIRRRALGLDVDEELERPTVTPVHGAVVGLHAGGEGVQVEGFEGTGRVEVRRVVCDEKLVADEMDVGLDAAEAVVEGVEEGTGMLVVVVGVGAPQRGRTVRRFARDGTRGGQGDAAARTAPKAVRALRRVVGAMRAASRVGPVVDSPSMRAGRGQKAARRTGVRDAPFVHLAGRTGAGKARPRLGRASRASPGVRRGRAGRPVRPALAVTYRRAVRDGVGLRPLQIQVDRVLPGHPDPAVQLQRLLGRADGDGSRVGLATATATSASTPFGAKSATPAVRGRSTYRLRLAALFSRRREDSPTGLSTPV